MKSVVRTLLTLILASQSLSAQKPASEVPA